MIRQNPIQYLWMFEIFCIMGWVWESFYESCLNKKLLNRGMLKGPYIPIYGVAGIIFYLTCRQFQSPLMSKQTLIIFVVGALVATGLEFVTGAIVEKYFHTTLWTYSYFPLNYKGRICLFASIFWGLIAVGAINYLFPFMDAKFLELSHDHVLIFVSIVTTAMLIDFAFKIRSIIRKHSSEDIGETEEVIE